MTIEEAIALIDKILKPNNLTDLQEFILRESWEGKTYPKMAQQTDYDHEYIKSVGFGLWQTLSKGLGEKVTKNNFRSLLRQYADAHVTTTLEPENLPQDTITDLEPENLPQDTITDVLPPLELPEGAVRLNSPFYVDRPPIEDTCYQAILQPGALIRLRGAHQMGKTSLNNRIIAYAEQQGYRSVRLNFDQVDEIIFDDLNKFLRWFCANISRQLHLEPKLDAYWDDDFGSKICCTLYLQGYILEQIDTPLVFALDEVNRLFEYPKIAQNFLPLLRSWYEEAKDIGLWQKLRLIVVHATEIYVPLNINQSPFNVGLVINLPEFTQAQIQMLAQRHGLNWNSNSDTEQLMNMIGGHPYLVRLALYHLTKQELTFPQLIEQAPTLGGIYKDHLRQYWVTLQRQPNLMDSVKQVMTANGGVAVEPISAYKLEAMGIVKVKGDRLSPSCELYRQYFLSQWQKETIHE